MGGPRGRDRQEQRQSARRSRRKWGAGRGSPRRGPCRPRRPRCARGRWRLPMRALAQCAERFRQTATHLGTQAQEVEQTTRDRGRRRRGSERGRGREGWCPPQRSARLPPAVPNQVPMRLIGLGFVLALTIVPFVAEAQEDQSVSTVYAGVSDRSTAEPSDVVARWRQRVIDWTTLTP